MPLGRYFLFVGSLLVGLLIFANGYLQSSSTQISRNAHDVDKSIIRIQSARQVPERIIFDTTQPVFSPPKIGVRQIAINGSCTEKSSPREALALMKNDQQDRQRQAHWCNTTAQRDHPGTLLEEAVVVNDLR